MDKQTALQGELFRLPFFSQCRLPLGTLVWKVSQILSFSDQYVHVTSFFFLNKVMKLFLLGLLLMLYGSVIQIEGDLHRKLLLNKQIRKSTVSSPVMVLMVKLIEEPSSDERIFQPIRGEFLKLGKY